uniref:Uncharacterized protein n=1 Tax=Romanomermis culicivorax TaxID=13658 RepID=A0A915IEN3_ROMCU
MAPIIPPAISITFNIIPRRPPPPRRPPNRPPEELKNFETVLKCQKLNDERLRWSVRAYLPQLQSQAKTRFKQSSLPSS